MTEQKACVSCRASWNLNRVAAVGNVVEEEAWWAKYEFDLPPPHELLKDIASFDRNKGRWRLHTARAI